MALCPVTASKAAEEAAAAADAASISLGLNGCCCCVHKLLLDVKQSRRLRELELAEALKVIDRKDDIRKQTSDKRTYRYLELSNGVRVVLVSDPQSVTSAAALDIKVGSFSDPANLQGLCHLCEHVLFTGSQTYPNESYSEYLGERGGSSNAYTASEHTNFHFDIPCEHFELALDRFVSFFECPLFRESNVQNELEIVQSEHEKNRWNDVWRTNQVERATANSGHAFSRFSTGNRTTLDLGDAPEDRNLRYELFAFFKAHFSSNLMTVCLIHNRNLDYLEELSKRLLLRLQNKNIPESIYPNRPFKSSQMRIYIYIVPVKDIYHVNLTFPMEDLQSHYGAGPEGYVAQLLGYKGPGGLFSQLRRAQMANHLVAGWKNLARGFSFFMLTVQLTQLGERHIDEVVKCVFQYIQLLKERGPPKWFFDEVQYLSEQQFQNKEPERCQSYASYIANCLHLYSPKDVLMADYVFSEWRPDLVQRVLKYLVPDNLRVTILSKNSKYFATMVEPHFGTDYHVEKIPEKTMASWLSCGLNPSHELPAPNELIDKDLSLVSIDDPSREHGLPDLYLLLDRIRMKCWYKPATRFKVAKSFVYVRFTCPGHRDVRSSALNSLFVFLLRDALVEFSYVGELAGIFYSLKPTQDGFELSVRGYSGKQHLYLDRILTTIFVEDIFDARRFDQLLDVQVKSLESAEADSLKVQAKTMVTSILCPNAFPRRDRLRAFRSVRLDDLKMHADRFRSEVAVESFLYGNLSPQQASAMADIFVLKRCQFLEKLVAARNISVATNAFLEEWFLRDPAERIVMLENAVRSSNKSVANGGGVSTVRQQSADGSQSEHQPRELQLPARSRNVFLVGNEIQSSSCVLFLLQCGADEAITNALLEVFVSVVRARLVGRMKSVVPLGYVVGCDVRRMNGTVAFRVIVESQYPLPFVYSTIEKSIAELGAFLAEADPCVLEMCKQTVLNAKQESSQRMRDCAALLWREISEWTYDFARHEQEMALVQNINMVDLRQFYSRLIHVDGAERRCLVVSIGPDPILNRLDEVECLTLSDASKLRDQCDLFPALSQQSLDAWFLKAFNSRDYDYGAPGPPP